MRWDDQGADNTSRYAVIPRTLCFLLRGDMVLLLRGAVTKRLWAGKWNGIGGHLEVGETPLDGARREIKEETGLEVYDLQLRAIVHISSSEANQGIMIFVYSGEAPSSEVSSSAEGDLQWFPLDGLPQDALVEDLSELIPRVLAAKGGQLVYGLYQPNEQGHITFHFNAV
ncbi:MAG: NUDIX hydrolase [Anaerolineae bacterium]